MNIKQLNEITTKFFKEDGRGYDFLPQISSKDKTVNILVFDDMDEMIGVIKLGNPIYMGEHQLLEVLKDESRTFL